MLDRKIAIVYDWLDKWGGVERLLLTLSEIFPNACFFTSYFDKKKASWAKNLKIKTSFIQKLPKVIRSNRLTSLLFYPLAFESFDFSSYDLVISVTSSFSKSVITKPQTFHLCYLLTPTRFLWTHENIYLNQNLRRFFSFYLSYLKKWDLIASQRPDKIISISKTVAKRCQRYYKRESEVLYPPFDIDYWKTIKSQFSNPKFQFLNFKNYYLVVSRLEPYKKVDLVVQAFKKLSYRLIIVGEGSQEKNLKKTFKKNIIFLSKLTDIELGWLYQNAKALIMPQEEDFGYTSLEAQFFGCPVIAYGKGGVTETVIEGKTGIFFNQQTVESLVEALERFEKIKYNFRQGKEKLEMKVADRFDKQKFIDRFRFLISPYL